MRGSCLAPGFLSRPPLLQEHHPPIPPTRHSHFTLPSYWPPFILSPFPSLFKMISRKHILPLLLGGSGGRSGRAERSGSSTPPPPPRLLLGAERVPESGSSEKNFATCGRKPGSLEPPRRASCWLSPLAARGGSQGPCRGHGSPGKAPLSPPPPASALRGKRLCRAPCAWVSVWSFFLFFAFSAT